MPLDLADVARRAAEFGGDEAVASVTLRRELVAECGPDGTLQPPRRTDELSVRLLVRDAGGRFGLARSTGPVDDAGLAVLAERARAQAAGGTLDLAPLPDPTVGPVHEGLGDPAAALDPVQGAAAARAAAASIEFALGRGRAATYRGEEVRFAVARSDAGLTEDHRTAAQLVARATDEDGMLAGYAEAAGPDTGLLDARALGAAASPPLAPAGRPHTPIVLRGTHHAVLLEPAALAPLLEAFARVTSTGHAHLTGTSPYTGRLGTLAASELLTLVDSPRYLHTLGRAIDVEGTPAQVVPLFDEGVATGLIHDSTGASMGAASTGHAAELGGSPRGAVARNLVLLPAELPARSLELAAAADVPVVRIAVLDEVRTAGPVSTRFRALGRAASLIDGGATVALLGDIVITGDLADLAGNLAALGSDATLVARLRHRPERTTATWCPPALVHGPDVTVA
ncbi:MAG: hypothetical protein J7513_04240 [Solirubrobacteraceae bacterium]|nr:hypothetical protein [Solirubrobacteraceae bacterium]